MNNELFKLPEMSRATVAQFEAEHGFKPTKEADLTGFGYAWGKTEAKPNAQSGQIAEMSAPVLSGFFVSRGWTVRDKTPTEIAAETQARREAMAVERWSFATAAIAAGIISAEEAQAWGPGTALPATVDAAITAAVSDPTQLAAAKVRALAAPRISRLNPLIEILRGAFSLTPEQADDLFTTAKAIEGME